MRIVLFEYQDCYNQREECEYSQSEARGDGLHYVNFDAHESEALNVTILDDGEFGSGAQRAARSRDRHTFSPQKGCFFWTALFVRSRGRRSGRRLYIS